MTGDPLLLALNRAEREKLERNPIDGAIRRLWWGSVNSPRLNTFEIAKFLRLEESFVANRLAVIRDSAHR
jgi:hypothetical protein